MKRKAMKTDTMSAPDQQTTTDALAKPSALPGEVDPTRLSNEILAYAISDTHDELFPERAKIYRAEAAKRLRALAAATEEKEPELNRAHPFEIIGPDEETGGRRPQYRIRLLDSIGCLFAATYSNSKAGAKRKAALIIKWRAAGTKLTELERENRELREDRFVTSPHNEGETWKQAAVRLQTRRDELNAKLIESERERETMLSALLKTTGSLGLIIKGAGAQGLGHLENYNAAKLVINQIAAKEEAIDAARNGGAT
jgi:hypothetical protein